MGNQRIYLKKNFQITFVLAKDYQHLSQLLQKENTIIGLEPDGKQLTSVEFSNFLYKKLEQGGSRLSFVIGDKEGLPKDFSYPCISLSLMTFTHQMCRLILVEQIYRAHSIQSGSSYHYFS